MTLEELAKALGIDGEESKDKFSILKKEFNSMSKTQKDSAKKIEGLEEQLNEAKSIVEKFETVSKAYNFNMEAEDFDAMLEDVKENMIKEAGGGATPEELKTLRRDLTKSQRDLASSTKQVAELTEQLNNERTHRINGVKREAIQKALTANNIIKADQFVDMFIGKVNVDKDETTVTMKDSAGNELSVVDAIADWAKENPEFVKKDVLGGMGSGAGNHAGEGNSDGVSALVKSVIDGQKEGSSGSQKSLGDLFG